MKALVSFSYKQLLQKRGHSLLFCYSWLQVTKLQSLLLAEFIPDYVELPRTHLETVASGTARCKNRRHFGDDQTSTWSIGDILPCLFMTEKVFTDQCFCY